MNRWLIAPALALLALASQAATLRIGVVQRDDDERLDARRVELAYPGHPGGAIEQAVTMAVGETQFELDAAKLQVKVDVVAVRSADDVKVQFAALEKAGAAAIVADVPAAWLGAATMLPVVNAGAADDGLRGTACLPNLFHTLPSERMRADALAQALLVRKWSRVLLLQGPRTDDAARLAVVQASLKRFGLNVVATKPFKLSSDPRERELGNPLLLTTGIDYDVVWVVDSDSEFARALPFRTALPRPVVGDGGLVAQAWGPNFERFGAPQLARRFARAAKRPMTAHDWAAWIAAKAVLQAALETPANPTSDSVRKALARDGFVLDGFKGVRLSFRAWDRQLRQPLLLTDGVGVVGLAPADGVLHPKNVLDTLGADAPESQCKTK